MPNEQMLSVTSLHTVSGASLAVFLIVQVIKHLPLIRWVPTKWLAVLVGELILLVSFPHPMTTAEWIVMFVNGLQAASAAIGGYQIFTSSCSHRDECDEQGTHRKISRAKTVLRRKSGGL